MDNTRKKEQIRFDESLKLERQRNNMTQTDLANLMSVSRQTVSSWEKGTRTPDVPTVEALAEVLHTSVYRLLGGKEEEETSQTAEWMDTKEIAKQLALLNSHYAGVIWRKQRKWRITWTILGILAAIILLFLLLRSYIFHYQSGGTLETKAIQEETIIIED